MDLLTADNGANTVSVQFNDGGAFRGAQQFGVSAGGGLTYCIVMGDVDGGLDLLTGNNGNTGTVSIRLNQLALAAAPGRATFSVFPDSAHGTATLTGAPPHAPLILLDALGRMPLSATADAGGTARLRLPEGLPAGVYLVRSGGAVRRLVVQ
ncbi:hypothetical protein [Hymenobacter ruricola]|uniref:T9SS type A sorting domain-containing protein n=1 Tax=Hymenobacter ruricola TaxID=2791023 RepID=A0ABS0IAJ2_9BACT|nr:hypothetical protein [Hymenobacter ruricola]MBF9223965.1 hypothetical protein [Hymenobacter ruricola]